jgi:hypothetical protein
VDVLRRPKLDRPRLTVGLAAVVFFALKLKIATSTYGTGDVAIWLGFADGVARHGPVGVYGIDFEALNGTLYNHPPLVGYYLSLINWLVQLGIPLKVTLRAVSSAADIGSALLVLEILRTRVALRRATASGLAVAASPVLLLVSGYHGNTDPLLVMLVLLGSFLIVDKQRAFTGGAVLALAVGVKLVPIVLLPTLAVYVLRHRRDLAARAALGFGIAFAVTWGPALLTHFAQVRRNVLGYSGISSRPWGLVHFALDLHWTAVSNFLVGPGEILVAVACALVPAALVWRRTSVTIEATALGLIAFLLLSPAFGVQYLAWAVAAAYLLDFWTATLYNALAGLALFVIYDHWNGGLPWTQEAVGRVLTPGQLALLAVVWAALALVLVRGTRAVLAPEGHRRPGPNPGAQVSEGEASVTGGGSSAGC